MMKKLAKITAMLIALVVVTTTFAEDPPPPTGVVVHVVASAPAAGADGSEEHPYPNLKMQTHYYSNERPPGWVGLPPGSTVKLSGVFDENDLFSQSESIPHRYLFHSRGGQSPEDAPIKFTQWEGMPQAVIDLSGLETPAKAVFFFESTANFVVDGLQFTGQMERAIRISGSSGIVASNNLFNKLRGPCNNNLAAVEIHTSTATVTDNHFTDIDGDGNPLNCRAIIMFDPLDSTLIAENLVEEVNGGFAIKHQRVSTRLVTIRGNTINVRMRGIESGGSVVVEDNWIQSDEVGVAFINGGGPTAADTMIAKRNTIKAEKAFIWTPSSSWIVLPHTVSLRDNVLVGTSIQSDRASTDQGMYVVSTYGDDNIAQAVAGTLDTGNNCVFNEFSDDIFFHYFAQSTEGRLLGGVYDFAQWQQGDTSDGNQLGPQDIGSIISDPVLDENGVAQSAGCAGRGYQGNRDPNPSLAAPTLMIEQIPGTSVLSYEVEILSTVPVFSRCREWPNLSNSSVVAQGWSNGYKGLREVAPGVEQLRWTCMYWQDDQPSTMADVILDITQ